jgi:hypothetical protein
MHRSIELLIGAQTRQGALPARTAHGTYRYGWLRTQQATLGRRGGKRDPLDRIGKLLLTAPSSAPSEDGRGDGWARRR